MFEIRFAEIPNRLLEQNPQNGFNLEDLFSKAEWMEIGDGKTRQRFGIRFAKAVRELNFPGVSRNAIPNERGGNEARYNYLAQAGNAQP